MDIKEVFKKVAALKVGIIGDVMLDTYMWGSVERISPEAPVPIVSLQKKEQRVGGAGNVALNIQSLNAQSFVLTITGNDDDAKQLNNLFEAQKIDTQYSLKSGERITTNKTRVISRNQHMMRLDAEIIDDITRAEEEKILQQFEAFVQNEKPNIVILQDYNKGVLTEAVIRSVISICRENKILTAVDPKRKNFFAYKHADLFKPNLKEAKEALNIITSAVDAVLLQSIHSELHNLLQHQVSLITLSEKGIFYQQEEKSEIIPSHLRNIADVSGAGDTVIATAALIYAATKNIRLAAEISNIAGGLVCEEVGTVAVNKEKLYHECGALLA
jgi:D-glycero-beta-D-manno-heptose-7-phosphate kinase